MGEPAKNAAARIIPSTAPTMTYLLFTGPAPDTRIKKQRPRGAGRGATIN